MASCIFPHRQRQRGHSDPLHFVSHLQAALCISIKKEWWDRNSPIIKGGSTNKSECCVPISAQFPSCCSPTTKLPPNRERETRAAGKSVLEDAIGREMCQNSFTLVPVLWDSSHNKERNQSFYFFFCYPPLLLPHNYYDPASQIPESSLLELINPANVYPPCLTRTTQYTHRKANAASTYLNIRSSTSVSVAPMLFSSKLTEWIAIISCLPLSDSSPPQPRDRLRCN